MKTRESEMAMAGAQIGVRLPVGLVWQTRAQPLDAQPRLFEACVRMRLGVRLRVGRRDDSAVE